MLAIVKVIVKKNRRRTEKKLVVNASSDSERRELLADWVLRKCHSYDFAILQTTCLEEAVVEVTAATEVSARRDPAQEGIDAAKRDSAMADAVKILKDEFGREASLEHPGYVLVGKLSFGTVNPPTWGWSTEEGDGGEMEVSADSQDSRKIAEAIEKVVVSQMVR